MPQPRRNTAASFALRIVHVPTPAGMKEWQIATRRIYARWKVQIEPNMIAKTERNRPWKAQYAGR